MPKRLARALFALTLLLVLAPAPANAATYPAGFEERTVVGGLNGPTGVAWTPDGRMLIIEKGGRMMVQNPGAPGATQVLDISSRVNSYHDRGLLGVAVDSSFASNRYIYLLFTYELNQLVPDSSGQMVSRLERFTLNADNSVSGPTVLLGSYVTGVCQAPSNTHDCIPSEGWSHSIGTVRSAPDGTLFVGTGDAASYSVVDPLALKTYDEQTPRGKILRISRDGRGVAGHPFCPTNNDLTQVCTKVWAKGFRNPFRFKLRPNGGLTVGDVGWNTREEVSLIDPNEAGRSWGWPCYEGTIQTPGYKDRNECKAEYAKPSGTHTAPDHDYAHTSGGNAVMGGPQYAGDQYPNGYQGQVFFADYSAGFVRRATVDPSNRITAVSNFATGWYGTDIDAAPDGDLVWVSFGNGSPGTGSVKKVVYSPGNSTPIASATADKTSGAAPLTVKLDASGSRDPDGDTLTYDWDFGDSSAHSSAASPTHTYAAGNWTARVTVSDGRGRTSTAPVQISAGNAAPTLAVQAPAEGALYTGNVPVELRATATDPQDGTLPGSAISWNIVLFHGSHQHPLTEAVGTSASFTPYDDHDADSYYVVTVTARDSGGLTASRTIRVNPKTVTMRIVSSPAGAPITYSGLESQAAPVTRTVASGYRTTISAAEQFTAADGNTYVFDSWSDAGARAHDVTIPSADLNLTATYKRAGGNPPAPEGLVGAWGFEEGSGTVAGDSSGRGNNGAVSGATWITAGRHGKGLTFDGVNDWVTVADSSSLDLTSSVTLSAWVKPRVPGQWGTVLMKEHSSYYAYSLYATDNEGIPNGWAGEAYAGGTTGLATGQWTHLTFTHDGTNARLYVNGALVATRAHAVSMVNASGPLRIGGNSLWSGEFFDGQIDDVRVYSRALPAAEVTTDMNAGVGGGTVPEPPVDTTAPNVAVSAPANGATVSGTVDVTATASDNVGVQSVQLKLDGQDLGAADTSAPYSASWDTRGVANGNHALTAVARDAAGNTRTATTVTVNVQNTTTPPTTPAGLVGAWSFDEGTGGTVADRSGRGNTGTISGASWTTAGRYGKALTFDGVNDWVTVADSSSLDLTGPLTLSAWVKPRVRGGWDTVVMKEDASYFAYGLYATDNAGIPNGWAADAFAGGKQQIGTARWTHLAFTFDGTVARLYVDGALVTSRSQAQTIPNTSRPLRIGGNAIWNEEWFDGQIDEVRVYNRALPAAEVTTDMSGPVAKAALRAAAAPARVSASRKGRKPTRCRVPDLRGRTLTDARVLLAKGYCKLGKVTKAKKNSRVVYRQSPSTAKLHQRGAKVNLTLR